MNVLFIDIDTLRPDHMGCYGYGRNTTPNIDAIAREGVRFDNYYCSDAPCLPSRAAMLSGTFGIKNGVVGHGGTAADRFREGITREFRDNRDDWNFHNIFRRAGLYTASVSTFPASGTEISREATADGEYGIYTGADTICPCFPIAGCKSRSREQKRKAVHMIRIKKPGVFLCMSAKLCLFI